MTIFHTAVMAFPLVLMGFGPFKQLPPSATSLVAECPRTSKFYLLAKIHKPGNPGRPTVSAYACPTEKLALYLDKVTAPFVRGLESHVKDTMDIKSLYTVIPNEEGLVSLKYFLDKREVKDPPTDTLVRMAELYHPKHVYTWSISSDKLPFLNIFMTPCDDRLSTSIYYKDTDSHSYLNFGSSHPSKCKLSIPHTQFLRLRKICSEDDVFQSEATTMETFFAARGYPHDLISRARLRAEERQRADLLVTSHGSNCTAADRSPLVITYYPKNIAVCNILLRNYTSLQDDDSIKVTFDKPPLKAFRRAK
ncbi:unnamed protein product, partial [Porites evermanni]